MKKLFVLALLFLGVATMARAADELQKTVVSVFMSTTSVPPALAVTGPGTIYGVVLTTGTVNNYCVFRDTATNNTTSQNMLPRLYFTSTPQVIQFTTPLRFTNGLAVNTGFTVAAGDQECAILYRKGRLW